ncbi:MAG TPA: hypothetical protein VGL53_23610 [Bryobacteraceae bacterium]
MKPAFIAAVCALLLNGCVGRFTASTAREALAQRSELNDGFSHFDDSYTILQSKPEPYQRAAYQKLERQGVLTCSGEPLTCRPTSESQANIYVNAHNGELILVAFKTRVLALKEVINEGSTDGGAVIAARLEVRNEPQPFYTKYRKDFDLIEPNAGAKCETNNCEVVMTFKNTSEQGWRVIYSGTFVPTSP